MKSKLLALLLYSLLLMQTLMTCLFDMLLGFAGYYHLDYYDWQRILRIRLNKN